MDIRAGEVREREDRLLVEMTDLAAELARDFAAPSSPVSTGEEEIKPAPS